MAKLTRRETCEKIADFIVEQGLTNPFGGQVGHLRLEDGKTVHTTAFSKPAILDGAVYVYGPEYILVVSRGAAESPGRVFASVETATEFIDKAFVKLDREAAMKVPDRYDEIGD